MSNYSEMQAVHAVAEMRRARGVSESDVRKFERRNIPKEDFEEYTEMEWQEEDYLEIEDPDQLFESESYAEERDDI
jgi:hypothetical protein